MSRPAPEPASTTTAVSRPVARTSAQRLPLRHLSRTARLHAEPGALVLTDGRGREHRTAVGPDGVAVAEHVGGPVLTDVVPGSLGAVDLLRADGTRHARLPLSDWVPEAVELLDPAEALRRSGLPEVLAQAGLALRPVPTSRLAEAIDATPPALLPLHRPLPLAYTVVRSLAIVVAVLAVGLGLILDAAPGWLTVTAGVLLLVSSVWAAALWALALRRDRRPATGAPVLRPRPGSPVSRRFRRVAQVRVEPDDVVVVDALGGERWLPRAGAHAVDHVAVVREGGANGQVELRTAEGTARATLPWDPWCAADDGSALEQACRAGGLRLVRPGVPARRDRDAELTARTVYGPVVPHTVSAALNHPSGLPGSAATVQTSLFALLLLQYGVLFESAPAAVTPLAAATLVLSAGLPLGRLLGRRLWLDRPA